MLAATLLVGGTFVGTKALFVDNTDKVGELKISTGDVDIEVLESSKWVLDRNGAELKEGTNITDPLGQVGYADTHDRNKIDKVPTYIDNDGDEKETPFANNLKPGDVLTKVVTVKNVGTLNAILELDDSNVVNQLGDLSDFIVPTKTGITTAWKNDNIVEPGETATFTLTLTATQTSAHNTSSTGVVLDNNDDQEDAIVDLTNAWVLTATQTTK